LECIKFTTRQAELDYDYIYIARINESTAWEDGLIYELRNRKTHLQVYEKESMVIFKHGQ
jgi:hypothetical protein